MEDEGHGKDTGHQHGQAQETLGGREEAHPEDAEGTGADTADSGRDVRGVETAHTVRAEPRQAEPFKGTVPETRERRQVQAESGGEHGKAEGQRGLQEGTQKTGKDIANS